MQAYKLDKIERLRSHLATARNLYEVRNSSDGPVSWQRVAADDSQEFDASLPIPMMSSKGFFFVDREPLYAFDGERFKECLPEVEPQVLFGVKSCDLVAISYQDHFFAEDAHYQLRRQQTILVGVDCLSPCDQGFCPTVDAGPFVRSHTADLILADNFGDELFPWLVIATNDASNDLLQVLGLPSVTEEWIRLRNEAQVEVVKKFPESGYIEKGIQRINDDSISEEEWQEIGMQCLSCSGCSGVCPTCSCYDTFEHVDDVESSGNTSDKINTDWVNVETVTNTETVTMRIWDSCQFEAFQRAAGDTNPTSEAGSRSQRFWYHKFSDDFLPEFSRYGCVGCGRCEQTCPGVVGVHAVMQKLAAGT